MLPVCSRPGDNFRNNLFGGYFVTEERKTEEQGRKKSPRPAAAKKGPRAPRGKKPVDMPLSHMDAGEVELAQAIENASIAEKERKKAPAKRQTAPKPASGRQHTAGGSGRPAGGAKRQSKSSASRGNQKKLKISFLGGLNEIGKNITVYECDNDMIIVDCGMAFPDGDMPGIDMVIPDFSYLEKNKDKIKGVLLTHGHEDHIGGLPYLLKQLNVPVFGTRLTLGLVEGKLREHNILERSNLNVVSPGGRVKLGCFEIEFIHVNHSIPDAVGFGIHTPAGTVVMTGDFKIDSTPIQGEMIDLGRFAELGKEGVLALLSDSTNAERGGFTMSERTVGGSFDTLFKQAENDRIIIASFASNIHRVQQIIDCAQKYGRKVALSGRSMINVVGVAMELGYLDVPDGLLIDINLLNRYPKEQIVLITTGSQGEPMSALTRMAYSDHRRVEVGPDDFIIISANPIPGNEKTVGAVINELLKRGCKVVYESMYEVHVSGHACQEELKIMLGLVKPKYFIPVHGEQKHLKKHAALAHMMGIPNDHVLIADIGKTVELSEKEMKILADVPAGRVLVDGLGVGDVGSIVLRDRKHLAQDGLIVVVTTIDSTNGHVISGPDVVSRGFVYVRESEVLMNAVKARTAKVLDSCANTEIHDWATIKTKIKEELSSLLYEKTKRSPMILPVIMEV